jgi:hypothetical protein
VLERRAGLVEKLYDGGPEVVSVERAGPSASPPA